MTITKSVVAGGLNAVETAKHEEENIKTINYRMDRVHILGGSYIFISFEDGGDLVEVAGKFSPADISDFAGAMLKIYLDSKGIPQE